MSATRPLIAALGTLIFLAGCATSGNIITGGGLLNPNSVVTNHRHDDTLVVEAKSVAPGDSLHQPPAPQWTPNWQLGEPDLIVKFSTPYSLPLEDSDVFRNFVIPNVTASERYVRALEFRLDNRQVVHHAEFRLDESDASWQRDNEEPGSGFVGMDNTTAHFPDGHFVNWVPGKQASELPEGLAWRLPAQADLVVQLHMMPSGFEEVIDPQIGFYFADQPPALSPQMIWLGSRWLPIAAGDPGFTTRDSYELPFDVEVMSVLPHCHFICKEIKAWAILPDGSHQWLVRIEEWDFYRQEELHFKRSLRLPQGTTVSMEFGYDNSADNLRNPNDPPQDIEFGPQSSNEMADLWIQVMPRNDRESMDLRLSSARHLQQKIIEQQEQLVELEPDVNGHLKLARSYRRASQLSEAVTQLNKALELAPENTTVLESLAIALTDVGRHHEALVHWWRGVQLAPNDSRAHLNLGTALGFSNQVAEAESHLKRATVLDPSFAPAFFRLGRAQSYLGRFDDALRSFRAALALNPNETMPLHAAARLLATHPDPSKRRSSEALELANRALTLLPRPDAWSLSTLATAQAAIGDFELATATARQALSRVASGEERSLGPIIQRQIDHYQQGRVEVARAAGDKRFVAPGEQQPSARRVE
jgi:tetratricopeptide (TPR) repeat protein